VALFLSRRRHRLLASFPEHPRRMPGCKAVTPLELDHHFKGGDCQRGGMAPSQHVCTKLLLRSIIRALCVGESGAA